MNPADVPKRDWNLYFNGVYMLHEEHGPCYLRYGGDFLQVTPSNDRTAQMMLKNKTDLRKLHVWWPRSGAYNTPNGEAIHIARQASRCMKKSASANHYNVRWGNQGASMFNCLARGPNYLTWPVGKDMLVNGACKSVAVARDLIEVLANRRVITVAAVVRVVGCEEGASFD